MTNTTSYNGLGGAQYRSGSIMGVTQDDGDNVIELLWILKKMIIFLLTKYKNLNNYNN